MHTHTRSCAQTQYMFGHTHTLMRTHTVRNSQSLVSEMNRIQSALMETLSLCGQRDAPAETPGIPQREAVSGLRADGRWPGGAAFLLSPMPGDGHAVSLVKWPETRHFPDLLGSAASVRSVLAFALAQRGREPKLRVALTDKAQCWRLSPESSRCHGFLFGDATFVSKLGCVCACAHGHVLIYALAG